MDDLDKYLDKGLKKVDDSKERTKAQAKRNGRMMDVLEDKFELINEGRQSESKAPFPESWKRGLFELYDLPMKHEWEKDIAYQAYYKDLKAGKFKGDKGTPQMSLFDMINQKENLESSLEEEFVRDTKDYQKDEISYEEVNFLLDDALEVDKDRSRDEANREISLSL